MYRRLPYLFTIVLLLHTYSASTWAEEAPAATAAAAQPELGATEKNKAEAVKEHLRDRWDRHVLALGFDFFLTLGQVQPFLRSATGVSLAYRFEADDLFGQKYASLAHRNWLLPALRSEMRYLDFNEKSYSERIWGFGTGAEWLLPLHYAEPLFVTIAFLPGVARAEVSSPMEIRQGFIWSWQVQSGFEYHLGNFGVFLHYRYLWFADSKFPLHGWGGALGVMYRL